MSHPTQHWQGQTHREQIITQLLDQYPDLIEASVHGPGDGSGVPGTPPTYTQTVKLLEQALRDLRAAHPNQWWHVHQRYIQATRRRRNVWRHRTKWQLQPHEAIHSIPGGWTLALQDERQRKNPNPQQINVTVITWNPAVRADKVRHGITWIANQYDHYGQEPFIPQQLYADVA